MLPLRTILVPTDFSDHSELAFRLACSLARDTGAQILTLHVFPPPMVVYTEGAYAPVPEEYPRQWEEKFGSLQAPTPNVTVKHMRVNGEPVREILNMARDYNCDLIVLGTHGRTGFKHLLMGSVAEKVVREAPCPVLTVKAKPGPNNSFRHINDSEVQDIMGAGVRKSTILALAPPSIAFTKTLGP